MATEDDVRRIALALPETVEKPWYNTPGFRVKDKGFLRIRDEAEGGLVVFVTDLDEKDALLASDPGVFFTTPHYDGYPAVLVNLPAIATDELTELIIESWRAKAPKLGRHHGRHDLVRHPRVRLHRRHRRRRRHQHRARTGAQEGAQRTLDVPRRSGPDRLRTLLRGAQPRPPHPGRHAGSSGVATRVWWPRLCST